MPRVRGALTTVRTSSRGPRTSGWIGAVGLGASLLAVVLLVFPVRIGFLFDRLQA